MTTRELMDRCQTYYGLQYPIGMGAVVSQYLDTVRDEFKPYIFAETVKSHSVSFKSLPDVSTFESVYDIAKANFHAENKPQERKQLSGPDRLATKEEIEEFERWFKSLPPRKAQVDKVKDWRK